MNIIKFLLAVYILVLLVDIILILILRGVGKDVRKGRFGAEMPVAHRKLFRKQWEGVLHHMQNPHPDEWKIAILEADRLADRALEIAGLAGENFRERIEGQSEYRLPHGQELMRVHEMRNTIIRDRNISLTREEANDVIGVYEKFLRDWDAL